MGNSKSVEVKDKDKEKERISSGGGGSATKKSSGAHRGSGYTFIPIFDRILSLPLNLWSFVASDNACEIRRMIL